MNNLIAVVITGGLVITLLVGFVGCTGIGYAIGKLIKGGR